MRDLSACDWLGPDQRIIRAGGHSGPHSKAVYMAAPDPLVECSIFPLHRGRRPYMAQPDIPACRLFGRDPVEADIPKAGQKRKWTRSGWQLVLKPCSIGIQSSQLLA